MDLNTKLINRRNFLSIIPSLIALPFISIKSEAKETPKLAYDDYYQPHDLWTPEEIQEEGFVFVDRPTCIHRFDDPQHPIMKSYCGIDDNLRPIVMKTHRYCGVGYHKNISSHLVCEWRGMKGVMDYRNKKDIFKPQITEWMKKQKYHYVYRVYIEESPCIFTNEFLEDDYFFALNVRGAKLPIKE